MKKMESESVHIIRESQRNLLTINRRDYRHREQDKSRLHYTPISSPKEVQEIANRLKGRTISLVDLVVLKNRLADNVDMVKTVLGVNGAMRGLIRELTGTSPEKQLASCACLCNICAVSCEASMLCAKGAAAYMYTTLESHNLDLVVTSAWCLGNMCAGGVAQCNVITSLGCHHKLLSMATTADNEDVKVAALYAIVHYVYVMRDQLSEEYFTQCLNGMQLMDVTLLSLQLLFYLSCHQCFTQIDIDLNIMCFMNKLFTFLNSHKSNLKHIETESVYSIRILANICCSKHNCQVICGAIYECEAVKMLLEDKSNINVQWLLGNLNTFANNI